MVWMAWILFAWQNTPASHRRCQRNKKNEKTKFGMVGREGGREGGRNMGCATLNLFGFYSLYRKLSLSITTSTHANHLIR